MMKKRWCGALLALALVLTLLPTVVFATDGTGAAIRFGTGGISGYNSSTKGFDYIYFGNWTAPDQHTTTGPIKWRVLDDKTNTGENGLFLLSDTLLGTGNSYGGLYFDKTRNPISNAWQGSDAQKWCNSFYTTNLTALEQVAVLATTKSDEAFTSSRNVPYGASENILSDDKVFFLSAKEVETVDYGFTNDTARIANYGNKASMWWLRSPHAFLTTSNSAGAVTAQGVTTGFDADRNRAARPAFNLNLNSVLFTSAATGGKSAVVMDSSLTEVGTYDGNEWKLTLKDSNRSFSANVNGQANASASVGNSVQIAYSGAQAGNNEYVSVLLCDSNDNILYYGNIAQNSESGTASVTIPDGLAAGSYMLKVFSEQYNGDKQTDYASDFQNISLTVVPTYTVTLHANGGTINTGDITRYAYGVGATLPTDVTRAGYTFGGWYDNEDFSGDAVTAISDTDSGAKTFYAKWTPVPYYPPSYAVTVEKAEHGSVTVSPKSAAAGATVTVTVTPDEGYTLETLTVTDKDGKALTLTDKGGGKYTFLMPSGSVTVTATFMDDNTMLNFFVDVKPGDYYCDAVLWAAQKGITSGTDAAHFSPDLPCTRAQIVTFLWRAAGSPVVNYAMDMTDVPEGSYYAEAVRWALSLGITTGTGADAFSPDAPCTRAQAVTFLARARNAKASGGMAVREFEDFDCIPAYAVDAIQWALENNVTTGTSDTTFSPNGICTRAQIVTFLYRAFQ